MTAEANTFDLSLNRWGLGFVSAQAEAAYCAWRNEQILPGLILTAWVSLPPWIFGPLAGHWWNPEGNWLAVWRPGYLISVPALLLGAVLGYTRLRPYATVNSSLTLAIVGSVMFWVTFINGPTVPDFDPAGVGTACLLIMSSFALYMRLPPLLAVFSIAPFMIALVVTLVARYQSQQLLPIYVFGYTVVAVIAYFFVVVMSVVQERFFRRGFVVEETSTRLKKSLEQSRNLIRRYVPPALAEQIIAGERDGIETPQRRRVTILFSDIVGFTDMADRVEPEVMTQVINEYMSAMADIVDAHQGTVSDFIGDGLMALFGAPVALDPETQARHAVQAAQAMQQKLPELHQSWRKLGLGAPLQIRIGINTGMVSVGSYGSEGRMNYTAIGLQTNIAARIQSHCPPGGILLSDATWQLIRDELPCESRGEVECKGVHFPVAVYAPMPMPVP